MADQYSYHIVEANKHYMETHKKKQKLIGAFEEIINLYSLEKDSNTPDFILAEYLYDCLMAAQLLIGKRTVWYNPEGKGTLAPPFEKK